MKCTSAHIALLAVLMYGLSSVTYLYGQAAKPAASVDAGAAPAAANVPPGVVAAPFESSNPDWGPNEYRTLHIKYATASVLAKQLKELAPPFTTVMGDDRTNQIIIHGPKPGIETAQTLVSQLDVPDVTNSANPAYTSATALPTPGATGATVLPSAAPVPNSKLVQWPFPYYVPDASKLEKAWKDYANLAAGADEAVQKEVLKERELLDQLQASGKIEAAAKLLGGIDHLLSEQARRASENASRATFQFQHAWVELSKAQAGNDSKSQLAAEDLRRASDDARRSAEQACRTIEQLQRVLKTNVELIYYPNRLISEDARRAMEVDQRIVVLSTAIRNLEANGQLTDKQKKDLDEARQQLKDQLSTQFDERQKAESEQLKQLHERLDKLEKEISGRGQDREKLIERRLNELTSATESADAGTMTVTGNQLTLENLNGSKSIQFKVEAPGAITITRPVSPTPPGMPDMPGTPTPPPASEVKSGDAAGPNPPAQPKVPNSD